MRQSKSLLPMASIAVLPLLRAQMMIPTANPSAAVAFPLLSEEEGGFNSTNSSSIAPTGAPTSSQGPTDGSSNSSLNNATIATASSTEVESSSNETTLPVSISTTEDDASSNETNIFESQITLSGSTTAAATTTVTATTTDAITTTAITSTETTTIISTISGTSFFDSNNNGIRDPNLDYPISSIAVSLYTCDIANINYGTALQETTTDFSGVYSFEIEDADQQTYYIGIGDIPSWYTFSLAWTGATDENGNILYPDATSAINPETGNSECFNVTANNEESGTTYDFGMRLNIPDVAVNTPSPTSGTLEPTTLAPVPTVVNLPGATSSPDGGSDVVIATSEPTTGPTASASLPSSVAVVTTPSVSPNVGETVMPSSSPSIAPSAMPSNVPSVHPSFIPSSIPSTIPSEDPSNVLSSLPSSAVNDITGAPSVTKASGEAVGPTTTSGLKMTLTGIWILDDEAKWGNYTAAYITDYFSKGYNVSNLVVSILVTKQDRGTPASRTRRELQASAVEVTYDQTTSYNTGDGTTVETIITDPFESPLDRARYQIYLTEQEEYYADVTDVSPVTVPEEEGGADGNVDGATTVPVDQNDATPIIIGVCVAVGVLLFVGGLYLMYTKRDRGDEYYEDQQPTGNGNEYSSGSVGSGRRGGEYDLETGSKGSKSSRSRVDHLLDDVSAITGASYQEELPGETFEVIAPAGKLGVVVDIPPDRRGAPFVCDIRDTSPLYGQIEPGDKLYAVDDEDVRKMSAIKVSKLLASKAEQDQRIITVFREYRDE